MITTPLPSVFSLLIEVGASPSYVAAVPIGQLLIQLPVIFGVVYTPPFAVILANSSMVLLGICDVVILSVVSSGVCFFFRKC